jgi:hypothetical protein
MDKVKDCRHLTNAPKEVTVLVDFTVVRSTLEQRPGSPGRGLRKPSSQFECKRRHNSAIHGDS